MLRLGLTGGIACGKSVVAGVLRELGCTVLDADTLAHRLIEPGQPAYDEVVKEFGFGILREDGWIDRKILGGIVFADRAQLEKLNSIIHPRVIATQERQMVELELAEPRGIVVVEAPLLVESGYVKNMDRLVVALCRPEQQVERLLTRGLSRQDIERRLAAQLPLEEKRRVADEVIDCSGTLEETRRQVEDLVRRLRWLAESEPADGG